MVFRTVALMLFKAVLRIVLRKLEHQPVTADLCENRGRGNKTPPVKVPARAVVKGDALSNSIAAASILAKSAGI